MLATDGTKRIADYLPPLEPAPVRDYSGFPWWYGLLVEPSRETLSADRLDRLNVHVFLPRFSKVVRRLGGRSMRRFYAVLPGLLFVPEDLIDIPRRDEAFKWAHVYGFMHAAGGVARLTKLDIERVRQMEAALNLPDSDVPAANGKAVKVGLFVTFRAGAFQWLGDGVVVEVVSPTRIGVEVSQLFGARRKVYVPAHEIEVM